MSTWLCTACSCSVEIRTSACPRCLAFGSMIPRYKLPGASQVVPKDRLVVSARQLRQRASRWRTPPKELTQVVGKLPAQPFVLLLHGPPASRKTSLALRLCAWMAKQEGPVIFASWEEAFGPALTQKLMLNEIVSDELLFTAARELDVLLDLVEEHGASALAIDSFDKSFLDADDLGRLAREADVALVLIAQHRKDGGYRGPASLLHAADVAIELHPDGSFMRHKTRFDSCAQGEWFNV